MRRIFISHSAKSTEDQDYLESIAHGLEAANFEVWLDRLSLGGGDDWNQKIGNNLVYCHGAVVLISRQSLGSFYVQHEISNLLLRWRRERDPLTHEPKFPLCPVLLSGEVLSDLETGFSKAVGFKDVDYISACPAADATAALVTAFQGLADFADDASPLAEIEDQIVSILTAPGLKRALVRAAANAGFPAALAATDDAVAVHMARCLLTRPLADGYQFLATLGIAITDEQRRNLFQLMAPGWVSPEAARRLADALDARPPLACIVNAELVNFTPQMYLRRARMELPSLAGCVVSVSGVTAGLAWQQLRRTVRVALAAQLAVDGDPSEPDFDKKLADEIAGALATTRRPILVALPIAETDIDLITKLHNDPTLAGITFLALCKEAATGGGASGPQWLEPELLPDQERSAFKTYQRLIQRLP